LFISSVNLTFLQSRIYNVHVNLNVDYVGVAESR